MRPRHRLLVSTLISALIAGSTHQAHAQDGQSAWNRLTSGTSASLLGVHSSASGMAVCGTYGTLVTRDAGGWRQVQTPTSLDLNAVWSSAFGTAFTVGASGTIIRIDGSRVVRAPSITSANLYGVWGRSASNVFAVGDNGTILRFDGTEWSRMPSGTSSRLRAVFAAPARIAYAVGENGTVLRFDGTQWTREETPTTRRLSAVWVQGDVVYAAGTFGTVLRRVDGVWEVMSTPTTMNLNGVWGASDTSVYAVGENGTILRFDGETWRVDPAGTTRGLAAIHSGLVVGDFGTILVRDVPTPAGDDTAGGGDSTGDTTPGGGVWQPQGGTSVFSNVRARVVSGGVDLRWTIDTATPISGFRIYRQAAGAGVEVALTDGALLSASTREFMDHAAEPGTYYYYWVAAVPEDGGAELRSTFATASTPAIPLEITRIFPNPFNASATVDFLIDRPGHVRVSVYDVQGRRVAELAARDFSPGANTVTWNGLTADGANASAGTYFVRLETRGKVLTRKVVLVR